MPAQNLGPLPDHGRFGDLPITRSGAVLWSVPYPQELNDIPMVVARLMDGQAFAQLITDHLADMLDQTRAPDAPALVMGIALHPCIVGQPHRLRHLRRALQAVAAARDAGTVWMTTPGAVRHEQIDQPTAIR